MRNLPRSSFSLIDVRHAKLAGDLLSSQLELCMLNADFAGDVPGDANELVLQFDLPV